MKLVTTDLAAQAPAPLTSGSEAAPVLSCVLLAADTETRTYLSNALAAANATIVRQLAAFPREDTLTALLGDNTDVLLVELDTDPERALDLVEAASRSHQALTVMVYSGVNDADLVVKAMRAGAREFLSEPLGPTTINEAMERAGARSAEFRGKSRTSGQTLVFLGAKGGTGVTSIASSFAVALQRDDAGKVVLADMDVTLGDAALSLGLQPEYSAVDGLRNSERLDRVFISSLLARHSSGLLVLGASDRYSADARTLHGAGKLLRLLRAEFQYVVADAGGAPEEIQERLFEVADRIYLITDLTLAGLRNANRTIAHLKNLGLAERTEPVLNRWDPQRLDIDEKRLDQALGRPVRWRIPDERKLVPGTSLLEMGAAGRILGEMVRAATGRSGAPEKKKRFGLFG